MSFITSILVTVFNEGAIGLKTPLTMSKLWGSSFGIKGRYHKKSISFAKKKIGIDPGLSTLLSVVI